MTHLSHVEILIYSRGISGVYWRKWLEFSTHQSYIGLWRYVKASVRPWNSEWWMNMGTTMTSFHHRTEDKT